MIWWLLEGHEPDEIGFLPSFLDEADPRPAREQFDANYPYGGYWRKVGEIDKAGVMHYPGDPDLRPIGGTRLRDEVVLVYPASFVAIIQFLPVSLLRRGGRQARLRASEATMTRSEIIRRLHEMVDELERVPEDFFRDGLYPMHTRTFRRHDDEDWSITLVVGIEPESDP